MRLSSILVQQSYVSCIEIARCLAWSGLEAALLPIGDLLIEPGTVKNPAELRATLRALFLELGFANVESLTTFILELEFIMGLVGATTV